MKMGSEGRQKNIWSVDTIHILNQNLKPIPCAFQFSKIDNILRKNDPLNLCDII